MGGMPNLRRIAVLSLLSIPVAAEVIVGEVLFVGHIVFLVEALGFVWGLIVFIVAWAALGVIVLTIKDSLWPQMVTRISQLRVRLSRQQRRLLGGRRTRALVVGLTVSGIATAVGVAIAVAGRDVAGWLDKHRGDVLTFLIAAVIISAILLMFSWLGRGLERWVRRIAGTAGLGVRSFATLASMIIVGPALSWLLFRLLGYSKRSTYALTVASAPVFGVVWVPFYALGVWGLVESLL
jgi:hypothetical protein